jgi:hypothetical protein
MVADFSIKYYVIGRRKAYAATTPGALTDAARFMRQTRRLRKAAGRGLPAHQQNAAACPAPAALVQLLAAFLNAPDRGSGTENGTYNES